jgi:hypothetical protein
MRHLASLALVALALCACSTIPSVIRIEVDGSTLEFKKKEPPAPEPREPMSNSSADAPSP